MIRTRSNLGRPPAKQYGIIAGLRAKIVCGEIPPGGRLPTRRELGWQYRASLPTVQQALDTLAHEGFVQSRGTLGTFVADAPPHLSRYALVFPAHPGDQDPFLRFWTALSNEAMAIERSGPQKMSIFYGLDGRTDTEDYHNLLHEVESHTLAGLVFATQPSLLRDTPLLKAEGMPRVAIMGPGWESLGIGRIALDHASFVTKSLDYLASKNRKKIAVFALSRNTGGHPRTDDFVTEIAARGMTTRPWWRQAVPAVPSDCAAQVAMLLGHPNQSERPDGLIIDDDNLVESITGGLVRVGVRVPEDMEIVGHCNFPWPTPSVVPMKRLGFDSRQTLRACIDGIDAQRRGEKPQTTHITAVFEEELRKA